jgi:hypothetical protein
MLTVYINDEMTGSASLSTALPLYIGTAYVGGARKILFHLQILYIHPTKLFLSNQLFYILHSWFRCFLYWSDGSIDDI